MDVFVILQSNLMCVLKCVEMVIIWVLQSVMIPIVFLEMGVTINAMLN